jgi:hypothetical protein
VSDDKKPACADFILTHTSTDLMMLVLSLFRIRWLITELGRIGFSVHVDDIEIPCALFHVIVKVIDHTDISAVFFCKGR